MTRHWPAHVHGRLYHLGQYPGAVEIGRTPDSFEGWVVEIDESELADLDAFEDVTSGNAYRRIRAKTLAGAEVWIYEYVGPVPDGANPLSRWTT